MSVAHQPIHAGHIFELRIVVVPLVGLALFAYLVVWGVRAVGAGRRVYRGD